MHARTRIVLFGVARSGSSLLRSLLASPPGVVFAGDLFHPGAARLPPRLAAWWPEGVPGRAARDADPVAYLETLAARCPAGIFGFKWNLGHSAAVRDYCIAAPDWRVVVLYRDNLLATYASAVGATAAQGWNRRAGQAPRTAPRIVFDGAEFARRRGSILAHQDGLLRACAAAGKAFSLIEYTELQRPELVANLARQLGYPAPDALAAPVEKSGDPDILARFTNPEAAAAAIAALGRPDWARERGPRFAWLDPGCEPAVP